MPHAAPAFLAAPGWEAILAAARERVTALGAVGGRVTIEALSPAAAEVLRGLPRRVGPGTPRAGRPFTVELRRLDAALRATRDAVGLAEALELVGPPLESRPALRESERRAREAFWAVAGAHPLCEREPAVRAWVEGLRGRGALAAGAALAASAASAGVHPGRPASDGAPPAAEALSAALDLGALLPASPALERSRLAAEALGDPHALDDDRPVARLLVGQLAARAGTEPPATALARRELLARFGVRCDSLSCDVLALGLPALGGRRLARAVAAVEGRHLRLTLAQLQAEPMPGCAAPIGQVFCCENPVVLAAAEQRLWPRVPPLVCTAGWPNAAACVLLEGLRGAGAEIRYHGDFDWEGLRIHAWLREQVGVEPWRMDAASYRAAATAAPDTAPRLPVLNTPPSGVDPALVEAMRACGRVVPEELLLDVLLADLALAGRAGERRSA